MDGTAVLSEVCLSIAKGEFFFILGPSGSGKTTLLRILAGLIRPDSGRIFFGERDVTDVPPHQRQVGLVFQNYALFPHLTVWDNVAYGLRMRRAPRSLIRERVGRALEMVQMESLANRYPHQLSGGQQQRVALARAIAVEPLVLLLDEPLSNLDLKLRHEMRKELKVLQRKLGVTTVFVTHDQKEALAMADRIAVLQQGRIVQVGSPTELYATPADAFVAQFLGDANVWDGTVSALNESAVVVETRLGAFTCPIPDFPVTIGMPVSLMVRPENLQVVDVNAGAPSVNTMQGRLKEVTYLGEATELIVQVGSDRVKVLHWKEWRGIENQLVCLSVPPSRIHCLPHREGSGS